MRFRAILSVVILSLFANVEHTLSTAVAADNQPVDGETTISAKPISNELPIADAGSDQTVIIAHPVTLSASNSRDKNGTLIGYVWSEINTVYGTVLLSTQPDFTKVDFPLGKHTLSLTVTNNQGATATDTVTVTVKKPPNQQPVAVAGKDQTITLGDTATFNAGDSHDSDGAVVSYLWTENGTTLLSTEISFTKADFTVGSHYLNLTVIDNSGVKATDTVTVTVLPLPNQKPVARAGANQTVLEGKSVTLDGRNSSDSDGSIKNYVWTEKSIQLSDRPVFSKIDFPIGKHTITLTVTDDAGEVARDTIFLTIKAEPNLAPIANAGADQIVTVGEPVSLNGELSRDDDGAIASYEWFENDKQLSTDMGFTKKNFKAGQHILTLVVIDEKGKSSSDKVIITINQPPTANAGPDQIINENQTVTLDAKNSTDIDGEIVHYNWLENGLSISTEANFSKADFAGGRHLLGLKVTDDIGASDFDTVIIDVIKKLALNDTGVIKTSNTNGNCKDQQMAHDDCAQGRDASHNDDSDGHAGFSFTKIANNGDELPGNATEWTCVKDNTTGLVWEVKKGGNGWKGDEGLHDADDRYTWYNTNTSTNGGDVGFENQDDGDICFGYDVHAAPTFCNAQAFVARVNAVNYCNQSGWRLPDPGELMGLVNYNRLNPSIDINYFPQTPSSATWTSMPYAGNSNEAWTINFSYGGAGYAGRYFGRSIRLVSRGQ